MRHLSNFTMETPTNEEQIKRLIENWTKAVRERDIKEILANHSQDIVMYDVPPPFQSVGIEAYRKTWDLFFSWSRDIVVFDIKEMQIITGDDVAFCFASMQCEGIDKNGEIEPLDFRLTIGLKKIGAQWIIVHEHHSLPAI